MNIVLKNAQIDYHLTCKWSSDILDESLCLLAPRKDVGSLAVTAERDELQHFLFMRHNMSTQSKIYDTEPIPGQMLMPLLGSKSYNSLLTHDFLYGPGVFPPLCFCITKKTSL